MNLKDFFQLQDNNKRTIIVYLKNIDFTNSYIHSKDEDSFKQKIFNNFNYLFEGNSSEIN
ncbi:hypothetical protein CU304_04675 [Prochlorococcus marinus str. MU1415]|nr:hypothetical protein [Prochlorococcus marinus str. MU1415]